MPWYTASIIISCRLKQGYQEIYPIYENFTLFEAKDFQDAYIKAKEYGEKYVGIEEELQLNGKDAYWKFEGIRKLVELNGYIPDTVGINYPASGVEVSSSCMEVSSKEQIHALVTGKTVYVKYMEE